MKRTFRSLLLMAVTAVMAAQAQAAPVTYTFTGTDVLTGGTISGTVTLDAAAPPDLTFDYPDENGQGSYWFDGAFAINATTDTGDMIGTWEGGGSTTFYNSDLSPYFPPDFPYYLESGIVWSREDDVSLRTIQISSLNYNTVSDGIAEVPGPWTPLTDEVHYLAIAVNNYVTGEQIHTTYLLDTFEEITPPDTTPPACTSLTPSTATLWPPNHRLVPITLTAATSDDVGVVSTTIISATSSEADAGLGDGDIANDIQITGDLTLSLRAERSSDGNGRTYTITVETADAAGNTTQETTTVSVPKSQGK